MQLRITIAAGCLLAFTLAGNAQQKALSLQEALQLAEQQYPALKQKPVLAARGAENQRILQHAQLPQVALTGKAYRENPGGDFSAEPPDGDCGQTG